VRQAVADAWMSGVELTGRGMAAVRDAIFEARSAGDQNSATERRDNPTKQDSPIWNELDSAGGGRKTSGSGSDKRYYELDHTHRDIEVYDKRGRHLGTMDPTNGNMIKPPVAGRTIPV
jgi:hypothetical protein